LNRLGEQLCVVPQNLYEFWTVCIRPVGENGLGLTTTDAHTQLLKLLSLFTLLVDTPAILPEWQQLVPAHDVKGKNGHDARLVAAMRVHGLTRILTFNHADFTKYTAITILSPASITSA
jgi:predicted nucleic acid-binding protein